VAELGPILVSFQLESGDPSRPRSIRARLEIEHGPIEGLVPVQVTVYTSPESAGLLPQPPSKDKL